MNFNSDTKRINYEYYLKPSAGRLDYWRRMAAPRFRVRVFLDIIGECKPGSLVDLGCGSGEFLREIQERYPSIALCGIDLSPTQTKANRLRDSSIDWRTLDLDVEQELSDSLSGRFEVVTASEIIEHVENPLVLLGNARRFAIPESGKLILSTQSGSVGETERRVGHRRHFEREEMDELLRKAGWTPVRIWNAGFPFHDLSKRLSNIRPEMTMKNFSDKPYTSFQKLACLGLRFAYRFNSRSKGSQLFAVANSLSPKGNSGEDM